MVKFEEIHFNPSPLGDIAKTNEATFRVGKHTIGASDSGMGKKKIILEKILGIKKQQNMTMLAGWIIHNFFEEDERRQILVDYINKEENYEVINIRDLQFIALENENYMELEHEAESEMYVGLEDDYEIRLHPDSQAKNLYCIEFKYTGLQYKEFLKDEYVNRITHYFIQVNMYLGFYHLPFCYLIIINKGIFTSTSKNWDFVWKNYVRVFKVYFDDKVFHATIRRIQDIAKKIEKEEYKGVECPEILWECDPKWCHVRNDCDNPITKVDGSDVYVECFHCKEKIKPTTPYLERGGKIYHYKDVRGHGGVEIKECINACMKETWRVDDAK